MGHRYAQQEETEIRSDGTKKVLRPARLSLARVSVLRGSGPQEGTPFIDDHIHTSEIIVDYLTEFSGIKCTWPIVRLVVIQDLTTKYSWRPGPCFVPLHSNSTQTGLQKTSLLSRLWLHFHWPWSVQGFSYHQHVDSLFRFQSC